MNKEMKIKELEARIALLSNRDKGNFAIISKLKRKRANLLK